MSSRTLVFTSHGLEYRNWHGRTRTLDNDDIESVVVFTDFRDANFGRMPRISIARRSSKNPISLNGLYWPADALMSGVASLADDGVSVRSYGDPVNFLSIRKKFPKHAMFLERNFVKVGFGVAFVGVIVPVTIALIHDAM